MISGVTVLCSHRSLLETARRLVGYIPLSRVPMYWSPQASLCRCPAHHRTVKPGIKQL
ncbi:MAG: hypothetical protein ACLUB2_04750 [Butyricicoccus pullicaecorum]